MKTLVIDPPNRGELSWLVQRLKSLSEVHCLSHEFLSESGDSSLPAWLEQSNRVVFCCDDRLSYRPELAQQLATKTPDVPMAFATSSWWEGAARTGIKSSPLPMIPWYRWHDGWTHWIAGTCGELFSPVPSRPLGRLGASTLWQLPLRDIHIIAESKASLRSWQLYLDSALKTETKHTTETKTQWPSQVTGSSYQKFADASDSALHAPELVLWDDSCLKSSAADASRSNHELERQITRIHQRWPQARIATAFSLPRWDTWQIAMKAGASEILAKPMG